MNQAEVNRAVARATGETVRTIKRIGFLLEEPGVRVKDPDSEEHGPYVIDWDTHEDLHTTEAANRVTVAA